MLRLFEYFVHEHELKGQLNLQLKPKSVLFIIGLIRNFKLFKVTQLIFIVQILSN